MIYNSIYNMFRKSPWALRKLMYLIPINYRLGGKNFSETYSLLKNSEFWDKEKIRKYQETELEKVLEHAVNHVPYYKDIKLSSSNPFKNLEKFPIIEKEIIQENIEKFISDNISRKNAYYVSTGGTSGNQMNFYLDNSTYGREWAFVMTAWRRIGFKPGDKVVSFRGVEFKDAEKGIYWQDNPIYNMLEMSPFHMSDENLPKYLEIINEFKPKYIHGYPSAITILSNYMEKNNIDFPDIKGVLAVSENIYPWQREIIENSLKTRLFSFYGQSERVIMASECEHNTKYHVFPEYGVTEILDEKDNFVNVGEMGELIGTSFLNYYMPFIRYRTGDYAVLSKESCECGREHLIMDKLLGRWTQDMIVAKDGSHISTTALNLHSSALNNVNNFQFFQKEKGELILRINPKNSYGIDDEKKIKEAFYKKIGNNLDIEIQIVDEISLTERGKYRLLIQKLELD